MARPKKNVAEDQKKAPDDQLEDKPSRLSYTLERELEEIRMNTGKMIDLSLPVEELEAICNKANFPPHAWRSRWENK